VDDVHRVAGRLVQALAEPYAIAGQSVHVTASVGALLANKPTAADADAVLQDAAIAMREAKHAGGARYCLFDPAMKVRASHRARLEAELRRALKAEELFVVLQPIVALDGRSSLGMEALVRWRHPQRGLVPPVEFIPVAEETGLIVPLGAWVLRDACARFVRLRAQLGALAPETLSVNLSRAQLHDDGLLDVVRDALASNQLHPAHLQLEVTESLAAQDAQVQAQLHALKALGVTLALDDFGTGYSSLAALHQLPVDVVKIDRSFVSQVTVSPHHRVLVQAVVQVCRSLGMPTVAEGIETAEQAQTLSELGCNKGQGYWFARPLEETALRDWLSARRESAAPAG
jgi:EAL domain-containing protein (putative c-di-GMP-specific phosphodiesterase class I)